MVYCVEYKLFLNEFLRETMGQVLCKLMSNGISLRRGWQKIK